MKARTTVASLGAVLLCLGAALAPAEESTLYQRLGGKAAIQAVVDDFVGRVAADGERFQYSFRRG